MRICISTIERQAGGGRKEPRAGEARKDKEPGEPKRGGKPKPVREQPERPEEKGPPGKAFAHEGGLAGVGICPGAPGKWTE